MSLIDSSFPRDVNHLKGIGWNNRDREFSQPNRKKAYAIKINRLDADSFTDIGREWNRLLHDSGSDSIFLTWEWIFTWWSMFRDNRKKLYILAAHDGEGQLIGIAPCYATFEKRFEILPVREIRFLGYGGDVHPDYLDFIAEPRRKVEIVHAFFDYLFDNAADWDVLNLTDLLEDSHVLRYAQDLDRRNGFHLDRRECATCPYASLPDSWEAYLQCLSSSVRYDIRRKIRKLERDFDVTFYRLSDAATLESAMNRLGELHTKRWEQQGEPHSFSNDRFNEFHMRIAERFLKLDLLRLYVLEVDGLIAALLYCYKYQDGLFYYQSGFDLEFAKYSLGTVAFAYAIQDAISEHIKRFDFLRGFHDYKYHWANADRLTVGVTVRRGTFAGRAYFLDVVWRRKTKDYLRENLPSRMAELLRSVRQSFRKTTGNKE